MIKLFREIVSYVRQSVHGNGGYISHTKISSYFILGGILTSIIIFSSVDIINAIISWQVGNVYTIPYEHIFIYSLTLTHHLILLGLKKGSDSDYLKYSVKNKEIEYNANAQAQIQSQYDNNDLGYNSNLYNQNNQNNQGQSQYNQNRNNSPFNRNNRLNNGDEEASSSNYGSDYDGRM
jgi:hypothetical protein